MTLFDQETIYFGLEKVISGGQTGADQAGLMAAFKCNVQTGGTAPSEYYTENGPNRLLELLGLKAEGDYRSRTIKNVKDSCGTVLITCTLDSPGSRLTRNEAIRQGKPFLPVDTAAMHELMLTAEDLHELNLAIKTASATIQSWILKHEIRVLNVAGNREKSKDGKTTQLVECILTDVIEALRASDLVVQK
jgi:hypothetical protein